MLKVNSKFIKTTSMSLCLNSSLIKQKSESQNGGNKKTLHTKFFLKTNISYPLICTRTCAYQGVRNNRFSENLACFVFPLPPFWDSPFCLINDEFEHAQYITFTVDLKRCLQVGLYYDTFKHFMTLSLIGNTSLISVKKKPGKCLMTLDDVVTASKCYFRQLFPGFKISISRRKILKLLLWQSQILILFSLVKKFAATNFSTNKIFFMLANKGINDTIRYWSSVFTLPSKKNNSMQVNFPISNITIRNSMRSCQTSVFSNLRTPSVFSKTI